jgi:hypothetical protein
VADMTLPSGLQKLTFGTNFNQPIENHSAQAQARAHLPYIAF